MLDCTSPTALMIVNNIQSKALRIIGVNETTAICDLSIPRLAFSKIRFVMTCGISTFHVASVFDDPDDKRWAWSKIFLEVSDRHAPLKHFKIRSSSLAWIKNTICFRINLQAIQSSCEHQRYTWNECKIQN